VCVLSVCASGEAEAVGLVGMRGAMVRVMSVESRYRVVRACERVRRRPAGYGGVSAWVCAAGRMLWILRAEARLCVGK
jgi:hypothetical protein